jgi:hypothetical protein
MYLGAAHEAGNFIAAEAESRPDKAQQHTRAGTGSSKA